MTTSDSTAELSFVDLLVNGNRKYTAQMAATGKKRACVIEQVRRVVPYGKISGESEGADPASRANGDVMPVPTTPGLGIVLDARAEKSLTVAAGAR